MRRCVTLSPDVLDSQTREEFPYFKQHVYMSHHMGKSECWRHAWTDRSSPLLHTHTYTRWVTHSSCSKMRTKFYLSVIRVPNSHKIFIFSLDSLFGILLLMQNSVTHSKQYCNGYHMAIMLLYIHYVTTVSAVRSIMLCHSHCRPRKLKNWMAYTHSVCPKTYTSLLGNRQHDHFLLYYIQ